jgi:hypothetical protein
MGFKVQIGSLTVEAGTIEEVEALYKRFGSAPLVAAPALAPSSNGNKGAAHGQREEDLLYEEKSTTDRLPKKAIVRSSSKREATYKLFKSLRYEGHQKGLRFLATKGDDFAEAEELRTAAGFPSAHRMSGFSAGLWRRSTSFGLEKDDVLIVSSPGIVGGRRVYHYRIGPEMLSMMKERGLVPAVSGGDPAA